MSASRQIIEIEEITKLIELRDWFAVIACYSGRKVLRRLIPPGAVSIGRPGIEIGVPGRPRIGVESPIMNNDALGSGMRERRDLMRSQ